MKSKEDLKMMVEKAVRATGESQENIALSMGYGRNYISEMLSPSGKVTAKFINAFEMKFKSVLENPNEGREIKTRENPSDNTIAVLYKLATANEKLADANQRLTIMLEDERTVKFPARSDEETTATFATMLGNLCEVVSKVATGKRYKDEQAVSADLYKSGHAKKKKDALQDNH